jgi:chromosome segregation ATPase
MVNEIDLTPEAVGEIRRKLYFEAVNSEIDRAFAGEISLFIEALFARLTEVEAERDALKQTDAHRLQTLNHMGASVERMQVAEARAEALETQLAQAVEALKDIADGMGEMSHREIGRLAPAVARATLAKIGGDT